MALENNLYFVKAFVVTYPDGDSSLQRNKLSFGVSQDDRFHNVIDDDTLTQISNRYYGDPLLWYIIADANEIENPLELEPGLSLLIPSASQFSNLINQQGVNT